MSRSSDWVCPVGSAGLSVLVLAIPSAILSWGLHVWDVRLPEWIFWPWVLVAPPVIGWALYDQYRGWVQACRDYRRLI